MPGGVLAAVGGMAAAAVLGAVSAASADTVTFGPNSPAEPFYPWTVPAKVCSATFDLYGAEGSSGNGGGARVTTTLAVEPGTPYYVVVGSWGVRGRGGYNGGGGASGGNGVAAGVGGGGATDVRTGPSLAERILVAGGGGGDGGSDGGLAGAAGLVGADGGDSEGGDFDFPGLGGRGVPRSPAARLEAGEATVPPGRWAAAATAGSGSRSSSARAPPAGAGAAVSTAEVAEGAPGPVTVEAAGAAVDRALPPAAR